MFDNHTILLYWLQNKQTVHHVANKINKALGQVSEWCYRNGMAVHPKKSQKNQTGGFVGPLPPLLPLNGQLVKCISKPRQILGILIDKHLNQRRDKPCVGCAI